MGEQEKRWTIFLSYSNADHPFADQLYKKLCDAKITVWYDRIEIRTGQIVPAKIAEGLRASDFLLVVLSVAAMDSGWVSTELITYVLQPVQRQQVIILPIVRGNVDPEKIQRYLANTQLKDVQWLKFPKNWSTKAFNIAFDHLKSDIKWYIDQLKQTTEHSDTSLHSKPAVEQNFVKQAPVQPIYTDNIRSTDSIYSDTSETSLKIKPSDLDRIVDILAKLAANSLGRDGPIKFFQSLVARATLPERWKRDIAGTWTGNANNDARDLVNWSLSKGVNREDAKFTTLGSILNVLLRDDVGLDDANTLVAFIFVYQLYLDKHLLENLAIRYQIPLVTAPNKRQTDIGPDITWLGPADNLELQRYLKPEPPVLDVGFLSQAIQRAASVCRIEIPQIGTLGTGFLIAPDLLLTNYHVLRIDENDDIDKNAREVVIRFGCITAADGKETKGQTFKLVLPVLEKSPTDKLDYVLLQVEERIWQAKGIVPVPVPYNFHLPVEHMGLHILQHPGGETMKLAINSNGVTRVDRDRGLVQYVTNTSGGSSGSPCFNDNWEVVALHHAERFRYYKPIREGILFVSVFEKIEKHLHH